MAYLKKAPGMAKTISDLEKSSTTYTINYFNEMNGYFHPGKNSISMLIRAGLINYYEQFFLTLSLAIMTIMKRGVSSLEPKGMQQKR